MLTEADQGDRTAWFRIDGWGIGAAAPSAVLQGMLAAPANAATATATNKERIDFDVTPPTKVGQTLGPPSAEVHGRTAGGSEHGRRCPSLAARPPFLSPPTFDAGAKPQVKWGVGRSGRHLSRMKPYSPKPRDIERRWDVIDAGGAVLGRLASEAAAILRGKHKPMFAPHMDTGDHVIVINAQDVEITGNKRETKVAYRHSGYPGGLTETKYGKLLDERPVYAVEKAIRGMLPKNSLGRAMLRKLQVYAGPEHPHQAQQPQTLKLGEIPKWQGLPKVETAAPAKKPEPTAPAPKRSTAKRATTAKPAAKPAAKRTTAKATTAKKTAGSKASTAKRATAKAATAKKSPVRRAKKKEE
jgi:large subunit ribosomal protein L13